MGSGATRIVLPAVVTSGMTLATISTAPFLVPHRPTAPDPTRYQVWNDSSFTPPLLRVWSGTAWVPTAPVSGGGGGGGGTSGFTVVDNHDGTATVTPTGTASITDNGDGTVTLLGGTVTDNGDGTATAA